MTSTKFFDAFSLVVTRGHSWSFVVTRGHSCVLSDTTIICRLVAGNFEDETVSVQNIIYRMTAEKFKYETNSTQMRFVE